MSTIFNLPTLSTITLGGLHDITDDLVDHGSITPGFISWLSYVRGVLHLASLLLEVVWPIVVTFHLDLIV